MYNSKTSREENIYGTVMTEERNGKWYVFIYALSSLSADIGKRFIILYGDAYRKDCPEKKNIIRIKKKNEISFYITVLYFTEGT